MDASGPKRVNKPVVAKGGRTVFRRPLQKPELAVTKLKQMLRNSRARAAFVDADRVDDRPGTLTRSNGDNSNARSASGHDEFDII